MHLLSRPRGPSRSTEWTSGKNFTFIVTLAANGSVTFAARAASMSRKSASALRARDPAFAAAWRAALTAHARGPADGDKVEEVHEAPFSPLQGDSAARALAFAALLEKLREAPPLAA